MDTAPSPEAELLIECVRRAFGHGTPEQTAALAERVDRGVFESLAEAHGLAPLAAASVRWLEPAFRANARRVLVLTGELCRVVRLLESEGIAVLAFKGPVLAHLLYRDPAYRVFTDLDLLVRPEQFPAALGVLSRDGYRESGDAQLRDARRAFRRSENELLLEHTQRPTQIDLHWSLLPPHFPAAISTVEAFGRARTVQLHGQRVVTLSNEDTLLFLCAHATKHCWSRLSMIADVCGMIGSAPESQDRARRMGTEKMLSFGLAAARSLLRGEAAVPAAVNHADTVGGLRFQWRLADDHGRMIAYILSLIFIPRETDWLSLRLPHRTLFFLYYPWRLLRLGWKWLTTL